ncbi:Tad domain-containing protein [Marimonas arenosa]|uniref:Tad domain-containing protein n=2 Tax=Marimonas arenosa TaxID=1795305 RepID=A0AAE4B4J7_9RHOB|nr:Tad domain-containing protein [Marimonas arenosa]
MVGTFLDDDAGSTSILAFFFLLTTLVMGGLAVDFNKLMGHRTELQVGADAVAHAALYNRELNSADEAVTAAMDIADTMLPYASQGNAIMPGDIVFGTWDRESRTFSPDPNSKTAVMVSTQRIMERDNSTGSILLGLIGREKFDVRRNAVFETYQPACFTEGFVGEDVVDIQSNNSYFNGFCLHSNTYVSLNSNNFFEPGTVVSMPDKSEVDLPQSGFETNEGLDLALRDGAYRLRIINRLEDMVFSLNAGEADYVPDFITGAGFIAVDANNTVVPSDFTTGRKHKIWCNGGNALKFDGQLFSDILLVTNCKITFEQGAVIEDSVIVTTNTSAKSITAPSGLQLGRDDACAEGGGSVLLTLGGVDVAANLAMFGSQILARDDVLFAARADGIQGASIVSGAGISGTSNMSMSHCAGSGMENIYTADYFRMVQ